MNLKDLLATIAPTVASAVFGPLGGVALSALGGILGISQPTQDKIAKAIQSGQLTPDQLAEIQKLEIQYQENERERGFRYAELEFKDREGARQREASVKDNVNRNLAYFLVLSFVAVVGFTLAGMAKIDGVLAGTLIGYLSAKTEQVLSYYFGSSRSSDRKTDLLAGAAK